LWREWASSHDDEPISPVRCLRNELFGWEFTETPDIPVYHADVQTFRVTREGALIGIWYCDYFARPGKNSGAWMSELRSQSRLLSWYMRGGSAPLRATVLTAAQTSCRL
jgi:Zn-dependent oligopeptidase